MMRAVARVHGAVSCTGWGGASHETTAGGCRPLLSSLAPLGRPAASPQGLLQLFQQVVELKESGRLLMDITNQAATHAFGEVKDIMETWRCAAARRARLEEGACAARALSSADRQPPISLAAPPLTPSFGCSWQAAHAQPVGQHAGVAGCVGVAESHLQRRHHGEYALPRAA